MMQWTGALLRNVACLLVYDFGQGLRNLRYDVVCTLDTAAVTELWRLDLFSCTSSSFLCAGTLSPRGKCCYFLREVWLEHRWPKRNMRVCMGKIEFET